MSTGLRARNRSPAARSPTVRRRESRSDSTPVDPSLTNRSTASGNSRPVGSATAIRSLTMQAAIFRFSRWPVHPLHYGHGRVSGPDAFDLRPQGRQLVFDGLIAPVQVVDAGDRGRPSGGESR